MSYEWDSPEDQPIDELVYAKCKACGQIEELNAEDLCYICEGIERRESESKFST